MKDKIIIGKKIHKKDIIVIVIWSMIFPTLIAYIPLTQISQFINISTELKITLIIIIFIISLIVYPSVFGDNQWFEISHDDVRYYSCEGTLNQIRQIKNILINKENYSTKLPLNKIKYVNISYKARNGEYALKGYVFTLTFIMEGNTTITFIPHTSFAIGLLSTGEQYKEALDFFEKNNITIIDKYNLRKILKCSKQEITMYIEKLKRKNKDMIDVILDCDNELQILIKQYIKNICSVRYIQYQSIEHDFILIKEVISKQDIEFLKNLNKKFSHYNLICIISDEQFVLDLLDFHMPYFIKKTDINNNLYIIKECFNNFKFSKSPYIEFISHYEHIVLNIHTIQYIESLGHDIFIHTTSGEFKCKKNLSELFHEIEYFDFIQIHKSYVVNKKCISSIRNNELYLKDSTILPIGRKHKENIKLILTKKSV